jgi:hypothetical protein
MLCSASFVTLTYSTGMPLLLPIACASAFVTYWCGAVQQQRQQQPQLRARADCALIVLTSFHAGSTSGCSFGAQTTTRLLLGIVHYAAVARRVCRTPPMYDQSLGENALRTEAAAAGCVCAFARFFVTRAWNRGENIRALALCCYYSPWIRAVDAVQHEHHSDIGHRDTGVKHAY